MSKKNFCLVQILIVSMLVICLLANTFAWSDRGSDYGNRLELEYSAPINGASVTGSTYMITELGDLLIDETGVTIEVSAGMILDFETIVINPKDGVSSNVSLFLKLADAYEPAFDIRVSQPTHEFREYAGNSDWYRVVTSCEVNPGDEMTFEWSLIFKSSGVLILNDSNIVLEFF